VSGNVARIAKYLGHLAAPPSISMSPRCATSGSPRSFWCRHPIRRARHLGADFQKCPDIGSRAESALANSRARRQMALSDRAGAGRGHFRDARAAARPECLTSSARLMPRASRGPALAFNDCHRFGETIPAAASDIVRCHLALGSVGTAPSTICGWVLSHSARAALVGSRPTLFHQPASSP